MTIEPHSESRRRDVRHVTTFKVAKLLGDRGETLCIIRNLSARGARIETNFLVEMGQRLQLQVRSDITVPATVRWSADGSAGVEFDAPVDTAEFLGGAADQLHPSRAPRFCARGGGRLIAGCAETRVFIENISLSGAGLGLADPLPVAPGDVVELILDGLGDFTAVVRWTADGRLGVKFSSALHFRRLAAWLGAGAA
ncbi:MAG: PilZ domain-containing protein [Pseudomonadota bacterium]|uniref:PilZ domain-containing protein n=1 Tax=Rhizorhabdus phycosphaerae TaxID=2711156 RepID=UPI0013EC8B30|nr:PilZ domain-containing protein [Rhizorhabdus phycosphaerae]